MRSSVVRVPASMLLDRRLPGTAKLLWVAHQVCAQADQRAAPSVLQTCSGLTQPTIRTGLARLGAGGWLTTKPEQDPLGVVTLPSDLLLAEGLGVQAKLLYGSLQLTPGFRSSAGQTTISALSGLMGLSPKPVRTALRELRAHCWVQFAQPTKFSPINFTLCNPVTARRVGDVTLAELRLAEANFKGEAIMQEYLSLIVASDEFEDHARPGFLLNPYTGELMEFDRYYPPKVAFEFNGNQHYGPTERYPSEVKARKQEGRDLMKIGICVRRGITLITVHGEDLSLEALRQKVEGLLPLRNLDRCEALIALLEEAGRGYRRGPRSSSRRSAGRRRAKGPAE